MVRTRVEHAPRGVSSSRGRTVRRRVSKSDNEGWSQWLQPVAIRRKSPTGDNRRGECRRPRGARYNSMLRRFSVSKGLARVYSKNAADTEAHDVPRNGSVCVRRVEVMHRSHQMALSPRWSGADHDNSSLSKRLTELRSADASRPHFWL